ncbi:Ig-like domain-containing protein [Myxococcota bacterium]|nr:Ig-like domain-containing protein [Myxococcota bacterium]
MRCVSGALVLALLSFGCTSSPGPYAVEDDDTSDDDSDDDVADDDTSGPDLVPPEVELTVPASAYASGVVEVSAVASDASGIERVDLLVDGVLLVSDDASPFTAPWDTAPYSDGPHVVQAVAYDRNGNSGAAEREVGVDNHAPEIAFVTPQNGREVEGVVAVELSITDTSPVPSVDVSVDGVLLEALTGPPFQATWDASGLPPGQYEVSATATDAAGLSATASIWVRVDESIPVDDPDSLVGRTYLLDAFSGTIVEPAGIEPVLDLLVSELPLLLSPVELDAGEGTVRVLAAMVEAGGGPPAQDRCQATVELGGGVPGIFDDPDFQVGPATLEATVEGTEIRVEDLLVIGEFAPDGSAMQEVFVIGSIDTRPMDEYLGGVGAACDFVGLLGISCLPCPSTGDPYCLDLWVEDLYALHQPSVTVVPRTEAEIAADPGC